MQNRSMASRTSLTLEDVVVMLDDPEEPVTLGSDDEDITSTDASSHTSRSLGLTVSIPINPSSSTTQPASKHASSWSATLSPVTIMPFTSRVGPTIPISDSPVEVFHHFAPDTFFGFSILMGIVHMPAVEDYWKLDPYFHYAPIADRISRNRFREITRYLHFADNSQLTPRGQPGYDHLGKVRPVIDHFQKVFGEIYEPNCEQAIDEAMIPFQGRSMLKQYLPMKPWVGRIGGEAAHEASGRQTSSCLRGQLLQQCRSLHGSPG